MARYDITDAEWSVIQPVLPQKSRGVLRVDARRVLNGIFGGAGHALANAARNSAYPNFPDFPIQLSL